MRYFSSVFNVIGSGFIRFFIFISLSQVWLKIASGVLRTRVSNCVMLINNFDGDWKNGVCLSVSNFQRVTFFQCRDHPLWYDVASRSRCAFTVTVCCSLFTICWCFLLLLLVCLARVTFRVFWFFVRFLKLNQPLKVLLHFIYGCFFFIFRFFLFVCRYFEFCLFLLSIKR